MGNKMCLVHVRNSSCDKIVGLPVRTPPFFLADAKCHTYQLGVQGINV